MTIQHVVDKPSRAALFLVLEIKDGGELTLALNELTEQQNMFHANMTTDTRSVWGWYNPQLALYDGEGNYTPNPRLHR